MFPIFSIHTSCVRGRPCKYADTTPQQLRKELKREETQSAKVWRDRSPQRHQMMHLMKLLVALALAAAPSARGMAPYATDSELVERVQELEEELEQCRSFQLRELRSR